VKGVGNPTVALFSGNTIPNILAVADNGTYGNVIVNGTFAAYLQAFIYGAADYGASVNIQTRGTAYSGVAIKGRGAQTADLQQWQNSAGTVLTSILAAGTINFASGNTSATATAGAITAPGLVAGYITMQIAGTTVKVPYYNN
jgi:hypothetical protein